MPGQAKVRDNLKNIDVDVPLTRFVAVAGASGFGKFSLILGVQLKRSFKL